MTTDAWIALLGIGSSISLVGIGGLFAWMLAKQRQDGRAESQMEHVLQKLDRGEAKLDDLTCTVNEYIRKTESLEHILQEQQPRPPRGR